ncbi:MAG: ParB/RepB/Spo0J family partition protein [Alphaproteobacteria bacterium]|jgi:ParB family chromosome partitioning protein
MSKPRGLGRGLSALMGEPAPGVNATTAESGEGLRKIAIGNLRPGKYQPRTHFNEEELESLSQSLQHSGMMQPIVVRPLKSEDGVFEIVAGERRWRAAQKARMHDVPVIVRDLTDREVLELGLIENLQREDLGPLEEAAGFERLASEFQLNQRQIGVVVGKSRSYIANMVRLLQLPPALRTMLDTGALTAGHGRALLMAENPEALAKRVVRDGLSVRETEALVQTGRGNTTGKKAIREANEPVTADLRDLQKRLGEQTGLKVEIRPKGETGQLVLNYVSLEQLDDMIARLESPPRPRLVQS